MSGRPTNDANSRLSSYLKRLAEDAKRPPCDRQRARFHLRDSAFHHAKRRGLLALSLPLGLSTTLVLSRYA